MPAGLALPPKAEKSGPIGLNDYLMLGATPGVPAGEDLMKDGVDLRQMAELGLAAVSLEYNKTNGTAFNTQFGQLLHYLNRQSWVNTNAIAWVGFSQGANNILDSVLQRSEQQPQLLVQLGGGGNSKRTGWRASKRKIQIATLPGSARVWRTG